MMLELGTHSSDSDCCSISYSGWVQIRECHGEMDRDLDA